MQRANTVRGGIVGIGGKTLNPPVRALRGRRPQNMLTPRTPTRQNATVHRAGTGPSVTTAAEYYGAMPGTPAINVRAPRGRRRPAGRVPRHIAIAPMRNRLSSTGSSSSSSSSTSSTSSSSVVPPPQYPPQQSAGSVHRKGVSPSNQKSVQSSRGKHRNSHHKRESHKDLHQRPSQLSPQQRHPVGRAQSTPANMVRLPPPPKPGALASPVARPAPSSPVSPKPQTPQLPSVLSVIRASGALTVIPTTVTPSSSSLTCSSPAIVTIAPVSGPPGRTTVLQPRVMSTLPPPGSDPPLAPPPRTSKSSLTHQQLQQLEHAIQPQLQIQVRTQDPSGQVITEPLTPAQLREHQLAHAKAAAAAASSSGTPSSPPPFVHLQLPPGSTLTPATLPVANTHPPNPSVVPSSTSSSSTTVPPSAPPPTPPASVATTTVPATRGRGRKSASQKEVMGQQQQQQPSVHQRTLLSSSTTIVPVPASSVGSGAAGTPQVSGGATSKGQSSRSQKRSRSEGDSSTLSFAGVASNIGISAGQKGRIYGCGVVEATFSKPSPDFGKEFYVFLGKSSGGADRLCADVPESVPSPDSSSSSSTTSTSSSDSSSSSSSGSSSSSASSQSSRSSSLKRDGGGTGTGRGGSTAGGSTGKGISAQGSPGAAGKDGGALNGHSNGNSTSSSPSGVNRRTTVLFTKKAAAAFKKPESPSPSSTPPGQSTTPVAHPPKRGVGRPRKVLEPTSSAAPSALSASSSSGQASVAGGKGFSGALTTKPLSSGGSASSKSASTGPTIGTGSTGSTKIPGVAVPPLFGGATSLGSASALSGAVSAVQNICNSMLPLGGSVCDLMPFTTGSSQSGAMRDISRDKGTG